MLENNAEYQRWKIDRRNRSRMGRDRQSQQALRDRLDKMREESFAKLGPGVDGVASSSSKKKFEQLTINSTGTPVYNTPEPSSGLMMMVILGPLVHWLRRERRRR